MTLEWVRTAPCIYRSTTGGYSILMDERTGDYRVRKGKLLIAEQFLLSDAIAAAQEHADSERTAA